MVQLVRRSRRGARVAGSRPAAGRGHRPDHHGRRADEAVTFGTNWLAEAEHGGFYQAVADGIYKQLRPRRDDPPGRAAGQPLGCCWPRARSTSTWAATCSGLQLRAEQTADSWWPRSSRRTRRSSCRIPAGHRHFEDLRASRILIGDDGRTTYWPWLKQAFGFTRRADASPTPSTWRRSSPTRTRSSRAT